MKLKALITPLLLMNLYCSTTKIEGYRMEREELMPNAKNCEISFRDHVGYDEFLSENVDSCLLVEFNGGKKHKYQRIFWNCDQDSLSEMVFYFSLSTHDRIYDERGQVPNAIFYMPDEKEKVEFQWFADSQRKFLRFFEHKY